MTAWSIWNTPELFDLCHIEEVAGEISKVAATLMGADALWGQHDGTQSHRYFVSAGVPAAGRLLAAEPCRSARAARPARAGAGDGHAALPLPLLRPHGREPAGEPGLSRPAEPWGRWLRLQRAVPLQLQPAGRSEGFGNLMLKP